MPEPDLSKETINSHACPKSSVIRTRNMRVRMKIGTHEEKRQAEEISLFSQHIASLCGQRLSGALRYYPSLFQEFR